MIEYGTCDKSELIDALEALAYQLIKYQNPNWYEISEEQVVELLQLEGLNVIRY